MHSVAEVIYIKVTEIAQRRKYDIFLIGSLVYTYFLTALVFAIQYFGLNKINPGAFINSSPNDFWQFLNFSLGLLSTDFGVIQPVSTITIILCRSESLCLPLFGVILVFSIFTTSREIYQHEIKDVCLALEELVISFEQKLTEVSHQTLEQIENAFFKKYPTIVNYFRRIKRVPEHPAPIKTNEEYTDGSEALEDMRNKNDVS